MDKYEDSQSEINISLMIITKLHSIILSHPKHTLLFLIVKLSSALF